MPATHALLAAVALLLTPPADLPAPEPPAACMAAPGEQAALEAERTEIRRELADIALGKGPKKKRKVSGGDVGRTAAGVAAGVLLPFPLSVAVNARTKAICGGKKREAAPPPGPNGRAVALIDRQREVEARLAELTACAAIAAGEPIP